MQFKLNYANGTRFNYIEDHQSATLAKFPLVREDATIRIFNHTMRCLITLGSDNRIQFSIDRGPFSLFTHNFFLPYFFTSIASVYMSYRIYLSSIAFTQKKHWLSCFNTISLTENTMIVVSNISVTFRAFNFPVEIRKWKRIKKLQSERI
jgi:hypothetical protein